jgi:protein phosphatase
MEAVQLKQYNIEILSFSEKGLRAKNEDKVYHKQTETNSYLFLLADGMGGYEDGEAAANTAIEVISNRLNGSFNVNSEVLITDSFSEAHNEISKNYSEAGTTLSGVLIKNDQIQIFWSGDVKVFFIDDNTTFSTSEHTLLKLLQSTNTIIKSEEIPRLKNTVTRAIGGKLNNFLPDQVNFPIPDFFKILICSDGVHQWFTDEEVFNLLKIESSIEAFTEIKNRASHQSKDNYSAILIEKK